MSSPASFILKKARLSDFKSSRTLGPGREGLALSGAIDSDGGVAPGGLQRDKSYDQGFIAAGASIRIRTIALIPFETMPTPQAMESSGPSFPVPSGARRSDMAVGRSPRRPIGPRGRLIVVPACAGEKITRSHVEQTQGPLRVASALSERSGKGGAGVGGRGCARETVPAHKIAQRLGADAALSGKVLVYQERVGSRLGADPPAVVGFEVKLVAPDGRCCGRATTMRSSGR